MEVTKDDTTLKILHEDCGPQLADGGAKM